MKSLKVVFAITFGYGLATILCPGVVNLSALGQSQDPAIHVCADSGDVLRQVPLSAICPNGTQSLFLKGAGGPDVDAGKPNGQNPANLTPADKTILDNLNRRLKDLETLNCTAPANSKVVAPFELKDRNGARIFIVDPYGAALFDNSDKPVARFGTDRQSGNFSATGGNNVAYFGIGDKVTGLALKEGNNLRIDLGKSAGRGNYRLYVRSGSGGVVAGIGVSSDGDGLAGVFDPSGGIKATMAVSANGAGVIEIPRGNPIAQLTEGDEHHGGKLWIGNAGGQGMVEAGDAGGYGKVMAGPLGFKFVPTPGLGLPGSVIVGK